MRTEFSPKVSVVVPIYQNDQYLAQCIQSICDQTLKELDIVLLDDGSPDECGKICDTYALADPRIQVIHKQNEGQGLTRNCGMEYIRGRYCAFVDSDDILAPDMYQKLLKQAEKYDADACVCGMVRLLPRQQVVFPVTLPCDHYTGTDIVPEVLYKMIGSAPQDKSESVLTYSMCTGIYRTGLLRRQGLLFLSEREYRFEDALFKTELLSKIKSFACIPDNDYFYRCNKQSFSQRYRADVFDATVKSYQKEFELLDQLAISDGKLYAARMFLTEVRNAMRMLMQGNTLLQCVRLYRQIAKHPFVQDILSDYPYQKNPRMKRLFNTLLHRKCALALTVMIQVNMLMRKEN